MASLLFSVSHFSLFPLSLLLTKLVIFYILVLYCDLWFEVMFHFSAKFFNARTALTLWIYFNVVNARPYGKICLIKEMRSNTSVFLGRAISGIFSDRKVLRTGAEYIRMSNIISSRMNISRYFNQTETILKPVDYSR